MTEKLPDHQKQQAAQGNPIMNSFVSRCPVNDKKQTYVWLTKTLLKINNSRDSEQYTLLLNYNAEPHML